ncbi:MAG: DUF3750 domain-containing protein [Kofleriaceae bacterium]
MLGRAPLTVLLVVGGCAILPRQFTAPPADTPAVILMTGGLPPPMDQIARHPWLATRRAGEAEWHIWEVGGGGTQADPFHNSPYVEPILHGVWTGAEAETAIACIERVAPGVKAHIERHYFLVPGPNSNTFGDEVLRACKLAASLPANSVGKDYRGLIGAGLTSERTGVQLETALVGVKLGLREGVEVHILGLTFGVDLWPPAILIPLGAGRIGFADR